jgi:8-oxo-dGTP diphosphatase
MMEIILASAAILINTKNEVLITERPAGKIWSGYWEFPGGKMEAGETPEIALRREVEEEIGVVLGEVEPFHFLSETRDDEGYHVVVLCYLCREWEGDITAKEKQKMAWVTPQQLDDYTLLPSNTRIVKELKRGYY